MTPVIEEQTDIAALTTPQVPDDWSEVDTRAVETVRILAAGAVQKVGNGHPGTAMSLAPLAYTLSQRVMRHDPAEPRWAGRDRFLLSCGHSSLTLYIQLHFAGFGFTYPGAQKVFTALDAVGIDLADVFQVLDSEGVERFEQSWALLLDTVTQELNRATAAG